MPRRAQGLFVPLFLAVRWAAARFAPLPVHNESTMRMLCEEAFQK